MVGTSDAFLFLGQGFGTSARSLECYLWFKRRPSARARARVLKSIPFEVAEFAHFEGELLHFGSGDTFEARVSASSSPHSEEQAAPSVQQWKSLCETFERFVLDVHEYAPLIAAIKPDDRAQRRGPWHRRSLLHVHTLAERILEKHSKLSDEWTGLSMNVLEEVLPNQRAAKRVRAGARSQYFAWLSRLLTDAKRSTHATLVQRATWLLLATPVSKRELAFAGMSGALRRRVRKCALELGTSTQDLHCKQVVPPTRKKRATPRTPAPSTDLRRAIQATLVPQLRAAGFDGSLPTFRRIVKQRTKARTHVLSLSFDPGHGGALHVELAIIAARRDTTVRQDYERSINIRNRRRQLLTRLAPPGEANLLWYSDAKAKWGAKWAQELARFVAALVEKQGEEWWRRRR